LAIDWIGALKWGKEFDIRDTTRKLPVLVLNAERLMRQKA
jgi:hypothetical protein